VFIPRPAYLSDQGDHLQFNRVWLRLSPARGSKSSPAWRSRLIRISILVCVCFAVSFVAWSQDRTSLGASSLDATNSASNLMSPGESSSLTGITAPSVTSSGAKASVSPGHQSSAETDASEERFVFTNPEPAADGGQVRTVTQEKPKAPVEPIESELIVEGLYSYGNYKIFASGWDMKLFTAGVEYDRHSWGYFLKARVDYVAEFLPLVLLDKPVNEDIWGYPEPYPQGKYNREYVPGIGFSPIGFRMLWRDKRAIKPYLEAKGGVLLFDKKVPSSESSYVNFSLQSATGVQVKVNDRWGLRLGLFSDFHFSDAFVVPVNPGLDVMNANLGIVYHFTPKSQ